MIKVNVQNYCKSQHPTALATSDILVHSSVAQSGVHLKLNQWVVLNILSISCCTQSERTKGPVS